MALIAPVPRPEDVGCDAFATLVRPDGSRRLLPDVSFLVQLKSASVGEVGYTRPDEIAWLTNLEIPLFIGRTDLQRSRIELFSTLRLHQVLLEQAYQEIQLLLDEAVESPGSPACRRINIGPPVHAWTLEDATKPDFLTTAHDILRPHIETLRRNLMLRSSGYQEMLRWETGRTPTSSGIMMMVSPRDDLGETLRAMVPYIQRMSTEILARKRYGAFPSLLAMVETMRQWGVDPDPAGAMVRATAAMADGPEISEEDIIRLRYWAGFGHLNLSYLNLSDGAVAAIPEGVEQLALVDVPITDAGVDYLLRIEGLSRLNLAGTRITDAGMNRLAGLRRLRWLNVERTQITHAAIERLKSLLPDLKVVQ